MNFNNITMKKSKCFTNFNDDILYPQLDDDRVNIILSKEFSNKYDFKYEDAITAIWNFLKEIIPKYGLNDISFDESSEYGFNPSFKIKVPSFISSDKLNSLWDDIFKDVCVFADNQKIGFVLDDLSIILCR